MVAPSGTGPDPWPQRGESPLRLRISSWSIVRAVLVVLAILIATSIVVAASTTLWWLAIAAALAALFQPAVLWLRRFIPTWLAIMVVISGVIVVVGLLGYRGFDELRSQFTSFQTNAVNAANDLQQSKQFGQVASEFGLADKVTSFFHNLPLQLQGGDTANAVQTAASSGGALFAIAMLSLLMLIFGRRMALSATDQIADPTVAGRTRHLVLLSYQRSSRYVWLMAARSVVVGIGAGLTCAALGMQTPTALGVFFGVLSLIPGLGIALAALPLAVFAAVTAPLVGLAVFAAAVCVQMLDVLFVQRRIESLSVHVGPGLTIMAILIGAQLYGLGGALVLLAVTVFSLAFFALLTEDDQDIFTAFRDLVSAPADPIEVGSESTGAGGSVASPT